MPNTAITLFIEEANKNVTMVLNRLPTGMTPRYQPTLFAGGTEITDLVNSTTDFFLSDQLKHQGMLAQVYSVLSCGGLRPSETKDALTKIIRAGLVYEAEANNAMAAYIRSGLLSQYKQLSFRWLLKVISVNDMAMLAISLSNARVTEAILVNRLATGAWTNAAGNLGFDVTAWVSSFKTKAESKRPGESVAYMCSHWLTGPFLNGFSKTPSSVSVSSSSFSSFVNQGVNQMASINTASNVLSSVSNLKPELSTLINGMLTQFGVPSTLAELAESAAKAEEYALRVDAVEAQATAAQEASDKMISELRIKLSSQSAMPTTMAIPSAATTIPDGTMSMVQASDLFPLLAGTTLMVPHFTWDSAHPDVPAVDDEYIFRKEMLIKALQCLTSNDNLWLTGHTGCGKTTFIEQIAARLGWPVARVAFDSNVDRAELVGRMSLSGDGKGGTVSSWLPGVLEIALSRGYILLCDELDAGHPNALYTLQPVLEHKGLLLLEDGGRRVPFTPMARVCATGNTTGNGDDSGLYPACRIISAATLDRFTTFVMVPYMTHDEEVKMINSKVPGLAPQLVEAMVKFAIEMRQAFVTHQTPISYSPRRSVAFAREVQGLMFMGYTNETTALTAAFRSKLYDASPEEYRQRITELANACFGSIDPTKVLE